MESTLTPLEREVLTTVARRPEGLEELYNHFHEGPRSVPLSATADAVKSLVEKGLLETEDDRGRAAQARSTDLSFVWQSRFVATPRATEALASSRDQADAEVLRGRLFFGAWKGIATDLSVEDFRDARREMGKGFPREFPE